MSKRLRSFSVLLFVLTMLITGAQAATRTFVPNRLLVQFNPNVSSTEVRGLLAAAQAKSLGQIARTGIHVVQLPARSNDVALAAAFRNRPEVAFVEQEAVVPPDDITPNDPYYPYEWHLPKISAPAAWSNSTGSASLIIAILDSGCDPTHPDLTPKYAPGWNTYENNADTHDVYGHGTAVAGSAAASSNNGSGVSSPGWGCKIMPMRVTDLNGMGYSSSIASALTWAADHGARVANISFAMSWSQTITTAAQYFISKGGVVTMSSGNGGDFDTTAENPYILTISATNSADAIASWSTTGNCIDLAAPGENIYSTNNGGGYGVHSGTSFSAPIVAGVAGLVISANPSLSAQQVQDCLKQSADDLGAAGWDTAYGWGRVNAARAVSLAMNTQGPDTVPPSVSFTSPAAGSTVAGSITVSVSASDNVGVACVTLYLDGSAVASAFTAPYNFSWNTNAVPNGAHTLKAIATDGAGNASTAQVTVTVSNADTTAPTATITSPSNGTQVKPMLTVTGTASDNVGVTKVELYVDGAFTATSNSASYSFSVNTKPWSNGTHLLVCKAYDAAGNVGASQTVSVKK